MSLTRDEWGQMWEAIKGIENLTNNVYIGKQLQTSSYHLNLLKRIRFIKDKIQSVVGQME